MKIIIFLLMIATLSCKSEDHNSQDETKKKEEILDPYKPLNTWEDCKDFDKCEPKCSSGTTLKTKTSGNTSIKFCAMSDGTEHGPAFAYGPDLKLTISANYQTGQLNGWLVMWSDELMQSACEYKSNKLNGHCTHFGKDNKPIARGLYNEGSPVGIWSEINSSGIYEEFNAEQLTKETIVHYEPFFKKINETYINPLWGNAMKNSENCREIVKKNLEIWSDATSAFSKSIDFSKQIVADLSELDKNLCEQKKSQFNLIKIEAQIIGRMKIMNEMIEIIDSINSILEKCETSAPKYEQPLVTISRETIVRSKIFFEQQLICE